MKIKCNDCGNKEKINAKLIGSIMGSAAAGTGMLAWTSFIFAGTGFAAAICSAIVAGGPALYAYKEDIIKWIVDKGYKCKKCNGDHWIVIQDETIDQNREKSEKVKKPSLTFEEWEKDDDKLKFSNDSSDTSLAKDVYNCGNDIAIEIEPTINEYKEKHQTSKVETSTVSSINDDEDSIYEQVMLEIEEDKKVKSSWARALAQSDGDKDKAESLYIKIRVSNIVEQKIQAQRDAEVWLDLETELMWEIKSEENVNHKYVWSQENVKQAQNRELLTDDVKDAFSYADKLNRNKFAGYGDWRLPTIEELKTLLTNEKSKNRGLEDKKYFIKEPLSKNTLTCYWSSTANEGYKDTARYVYFNHGDVGYYNKHNVNYVRCVRAGKEIDQSKEEKINMILKPANQKQSAKVIHIKQGSFQEPEALKYFKIFYDDDMKYID